MSAALSLREFTRLIENAMEQRFGNQHFWVIAEISSLTHFAPSHTFYFRFVEKDDATGKVCAEISAVAFGNAAYEVESFEQQTGQRFQNGIQVLASVSVNYHPVHGLKLNLQKLDLNFTLGRLQQQREATLQRLLKENPDAVTFAENRFITRNQLIKLPLVIQKIAVISSESSAGYQDFRHTLSQNAFGYDFQIDVFPVPVQGEDNVKPVVDRLKEIYHSGKSYQAVIIVRGGGAQTDFLLFDSYPLARAIARFPVAVITGLGHQKDISVSDMMAHTALKTPTKVAEFIIAHNRAFEDQLLKTRNQLVIKVQQNLSVTNENISRLRNSVINNGRLFLTEQKEQLRDSRQGLINDANSLIRRHSQLVQQVSAEVLSKPVIRVAALQQDLRHIAVNMKNSAGRFLQLKSAELNHYKAVFQILSPENTLKRGFALVRQKGKIVTDPSNIEVGNAIEVYLGDQEIKTVVKSKKTVNARRSKL